LVTVIVCTYRRADELEQLLRCLARQTCDRFEVLIVDGSGDDATVRDSVDRYQREEAPRFDLRLIASPKGLTRQRNIGIGQARGEIVAFFDDDIAIGDGFLDQVVQVFSDPNHQDVGGVCGYDVLHYSSPVTMRWRMRRWLRVVHSLEPGAVDHLGRNVPLSFLRPFSGCREVGWFSGFCMIYRRAALGNLHFDEGLPTYGGEDRDLSMEVAKRWRLLLCGDLHVEHRASNQNRVFDSQRVYQTGFGTGRGFAKRVRTVADYGTIAWYTVGEFIVDMLSFLRRPTRANLCSAIARPRGIIAGYRSLKRGSQPS
jgi:glycosyltransferase involved in cell wall biosynthesis